MRLTEKKKPAWDPKIAKASQHVTDTIRKCFFNPITSLPHQCAAPKETHFPSTPGHNQLSFCHLPPTPPPALLFHLPSSMSRLLFITIENISSTEWGLSSIKPYVRLPNFLSHFHFFSLLILLREIRYECFSRVSSWGQMSYLGGRK